MTARRRQHLQTSQIGWNRLTLMQVREWWKYLSPTKLTFQIESYLQRRARNSPTHTALHSLNAQLKLVPILTSSSLMLRAKLWKTVLHNQLLIRKLMGMQLINLQRPVLRKIESNLVKMFNKKKKLEAAVAEQCTYWSNNDNKDMSMNTAIAIVRIRTLMKK